MTYDELKGRVLDGYWYTMDTGGKTGERKVRVNCGKGGILAMIASFEKQGIPAEMAAELIICYSDMGPLPLSVLKVTKKSKDESN